MSEIIANGAYIDKYNPKEFKYFSLLERVKSHFPNGQITKHMLLHGNSGLGKSSLIKTILGKKMFYVNGGSEASVNLLKKGTKLYDYCEGFSFDDGQKYVFFDEIDGSSKAFFKALKTFMDDFKDVIFVATTNYMKDIPVFNLSRFDLVDFDAQSEQEKSEQMVMYVTRAKKILRNEGVEFSVQAVEKLCKVNFPDYRKILQTIQRIVENGVKVLTEDISVEKSFSSFEAYEIVSTRVGTQEQKNVQIHQYATSVISPTNVVEEFDDSFFDYLKEKHPSKIMGYGDSVIIIARHCDMMRNRVNPNIVLKSLLYSLEKVLGSIK